MLDQIKKSMGTDGQSRGMGKKVVAFFAFGAIILVFVFLGVGTDQLGLSGGGIVGQVNNATISVRDFRSEVERMERFIPGGVNPSFAQQIRETAINSLIDRELLYQKTEEEGVFVSDDEIREVIFNHPAFQENGRFQPTRYEATLRSNRLSIGQFESAIRKDAAGTRLRRLIAMALYPSQGEIDRVQQSRGKKAKVDYVDFTQKTLATQLRSKVTMPSSFDDAMKKEIEDYYKANTSKYSQKEQVRARHILIKTDKRSDAEAKKKIEEIAKELTSKNFADQAKKLSEDLGSGKKGGDLGYFTRGRMVKPFEDKAFTLKPGEISEPVKSQFGYHVIYVVDKKAASTKELATVEKDIARQILAERMARETINDLKAKVEAGDMAAVTAFNKQAGFKWKTTTEFDMASEFIGGIGRSEEIISAGFNLKKDEMAKELFKISGRTYIVKGHSVVTSQNDQSKPDELNEELAQVQANDAFLRLRKQWRDSAEIETNAQYILQN